MEIIETFNAEKKGFESYTIRPTVKVVIVNNKNEVLTFSNMLIGGGIDNDETFEEAIARECLEEAGVVVEIKENLGTVIQYRDFLEQRYEITGFLANYIETVSLPTTTQEDELSSKLEWKTFDNAISYLEQKIEKIQDPEQKDYEGDRLQAGIYSSKTHILFLKKAKLILSL